MKFEFQVIKRYPMLVLGSHYRTSFRVKVSQILIKYPKGFKNLNQEKYRNGKIYIHVNSHGQSSTHGNLIRFLLWRLKGMLHILKD